MDVALRLIAGLIAVLIASTATAQDSQASNTILVLDGSGSMWGQLEGVPKISIAREVIGDMMTDWSESSQLGLVVYGHRVKGDCDDIETLIPVGRLDKAQFRAALDSINPKGKTPLSAAVRSAAELLKWQEDAATVILVSDGRETCDLDPCAVAEELESSGINFTAHVIGFDIADQNDVAQLQCIARNTGGRYVSARDAATLTTAMDEVVQEIRSGGISFVARLQKDDSPLTQGVSWIVTEPQADFEGKYTTVARSGAARASISLNNGTYRVVAKRGAARVSKVVTIDDQTQEIALVFGAGDVFLRAKLHAAGEPLERGVSWRVYEPEPDFQGKYKEVTRSGASQATFTLPAGQYRITARAGKASTTEVVEIVGGEKKGVVFNLNGAYVKAIASLGEGGEALTRRLVWTVTGTKQQLDGSYEQIDRSGADQPLFTLPAGTYRMVVRRDSASTVKEISLNAGDEVRHLQSLDAGIVSAFATLVDGGDVIGRRVNWTLTNAEPDASGEYETIAQSGADNWVFAAPAGTYRLVVKRDKASAAVPLNIELGSEQRVGVSLDAGTLSPKATFNGQALNRSLNWSVFAEGRSVARSGGAKPTFTLPAGSYELRVEARNPKGSAQRSLTLEPGQELPLILELAPPPN